MTDKKTDKAEEITDQDLDAVQGAGGKLSPKKPQEGDSYYEYKLKNVMVKSYQTGGSGD